MDTHRTVKQFPSLLRLGALIGFAACLGIADDAAATKADFNPPSACRRDNTVVARVGALEQIYFYDRFGSFNPGGMLFALRRDIVETGEDDQVAGDASTGTAIPPEAGEHDRTLAGSVRLRPDKRPRPIVLRANEGDCLRVELTNFLTPQRDGEEHVTDPATGRTISIDSEEPATRSVSMHVNGLELSGSIASDGMNVGFNPSSLVKPGETRVYTWIARKEGGFLLYSMAAPAGGEGDGGQLGLGLFGTVNVEPAGSKWYRSQVSGPQLAAATKGQSARGTPKIEYSAKDAHGVPVLDLVADSDSAFAAHEIVHTDLNAIIDPRQAGENCDTVKGPSSSCGQPFREFSTIFHDEITAVQAFPELEDEENPISALKDGMGINYGAAGLGAMVLANRKGVGPTKDCAECKLEEFFLSSWAMGDPALVVERDADNKAVRALYPDDPSNVHHSYLGDPVRFRNLHAGPKETHVFHLHAHQWTQDWHDPDSVYLDSQTISPGASFTYEIQYGGSGNRNLTPGDAIFHCHLYPHFAQGMWELWRTHDVFEAGTHDRWLPDAEIAGGTPNPAIVPLPDAPLPPMPSSGFKGYPFYVAGIAGHRPPQPPLDIDPNAYAEDTSNTLMRHVVLQGERETGVGLFGKGAGGTATDLEKKYFDTSIAEDDPLGQSNRIAARVRSENGSDSLFSLAAKLTKAWIRRLPLDGTPEEKTAMEFHEGIGPNAVTVERSRFGVPEKAYPTCVADGTCDAPQKRVLFRVNGYAPKPGAPFADPCPSRFYVGKKDDNPDDPSKWALLPPERKYRATYLQFDMPVNKHGWHDPQARIITLEEDAKTTLDHTRTPEPFFFRANSGECVVFEATNLIPSNLNLDDFQVFTPTDTIGQHIHLVKFDVTSSDGSGNGWNYEDGTFSPDEIRERIIANNAFKGTAELRPLTHRLFRVGGALAGDPRGQCPQALPADPREAEKLLEDHPWCGAQSTIQRWWADPLLNQNGDDRTIRTVFTHDHFGPSSHQQHGFYAALVIEPNGSSWQTLAGKPFGGQDDSGAPIVSRADGGPTSFAANIIGPKKPDGSRAFSKREYNMAVADFSLLYSAPPRNKPINPPARLDHDLPQMVFNSSIPRPEGIAVSDPGGQLINYRNEPVPLRVGEENAAGQWKLKALNPSAAQLSACRAAIAAEPATKAKYEGVCPGDGSAADTACLVRIYKNLCDRSDIANVFSTFVHTDQDNEIRQRIAAENRPYDTRRIFLDTYLKRDCADTAQSNCNEPAGLRRDGDPGTPILAAREGDDVQVRLVQGAQEENHIFFMNGAKWLAEPGSPESGYRAAQNIGISEHFEFNINIEDPAPQKTKDHLYGTTATDNFWDGQWGVMRLASAADAVSGLAPLPTNAAAETTTRPNQSVCEAELPRRHFVVEAWRLADLMANGGLSYHARRKIEDPNAIVYLASKEELQQPAVNGSRPAPQVLVGHDVSDAALVAAGRKSPEPLILRARAGECIEVELWNRMKAEREDISDPLNWSWTMMPPIADGLNYNDLPASRAIGLHAQLVAGNTIINDGSAVGINQSSLAYPCDPTDPLQFCASTPGGQLPDGRYLFDNRATYRWYAGDWAKKPRDDKPKFTPIEFGAVGLQNFGDVIKGSSHGTIGALVVEPEGAQWQTDCQMLRTSNDVDSASRYACLNAAATVKSPTGEQFREFVLIYQNDASVRYRGEPLANLRNGDDAEDSGQKAFNYRFEPFWARLDANPAADPGEMMDYDYSNVLSSKVEDGHGDPSTPLFTTAAGMPVRWRIVQPAGHPRNGAFALSGHDWVNYPWTANSTVQTADPGPQNRVGVVNAIGPGRHVNVLLESAGGREKLPGDYLYRTPLGFAFGGGQWGIMRVYDPKACDEKAGDDETDHAFVYGHILDQRTGRHQICK